MAGTGSGRARKKIDIERLVTSKGSQGGQISNWEVFLPRIWAGVSNLSGNERRSTNSGGEVAEARTEFRIRYRIGIDTTMRILYSGKVYNIRHIKDYEEEHNWLILTADTGVNDGR
ncbi:phage head closure protein [Methylovorus menthalis]|uniref:phage head closure protein n=1 Tax=Methylovorus menthalis TaxID=1002227 RepID=UPI001E6237BA|nr:phage head closure protein [Methylovorus menthalis]MCB4811693.1 phage head closure protein [Methylovorus menthalis]